jgi:hypothetical protein
VHSFGILSVAEIVLLGVGVAEDVIADQVYEDDGSGGKRPEFHGVEDEVAGLEGVHERHPCQIAKGEHETESVGGDIHSGE